MWDSIASPDFYLAVVSSEDETICWLHDGHWNRVVRNINGVVRWLLLRLSLHSPTTVMSLSLWRLGLLLTELRHVTLRHLPKGLSKTLLKVYLITKLVKISDSGLIRKLIASFLRVLAITECICFWPKTKFVSNRSGPGSISLFKKQTQQRLQEQINHFKPAA